jgi:ABC-type multidrug transport system ATPase subunit
MLVIEGLSKQYPGGVHALRGVSLKVAPGLFGLLGPNGAGKSTLMRTLATLQDADSGSARLGDLDLLRDFERTRAVLGYLPQEFGVYPTSSAEQLLDYLAILKGIHRASDRRAEIERLLVKVNLWDVRKRPLGTYSGGMRQRFGIAQALIGSPKLVIVDEPTAGLDPEERMRFHNLLAQIGEDVVVILSTHIVHDVAELCGQMAILALGEVRAVGDPLELTAALRGRVFRRFIAPAELAPDPAITVLSTRLQAGRPVVQALADASPGAGWDLIEPTLEDVYFSQLRAASVAA